MDFKFAESRFFQPPIVHFREWIGAGAGRLGVAAAAVILERWFSGEGER